MQIRPLSEELQKVAIEELNEDPSKIEKHLEHLRQWLKTQPHLNVRSDDQSLIAFLRGCKWNLTRTKEKLDYFYTIRTQRTEFFLNRYPFDPLTQRILQCGLLQILPNTEESNGSRIIFGDCTKIDYKTMKLTEIMKLFFMTIDVLMVEDDNFLICGKTIISNCEGIPFSFYLQMTPLLIRKFVNCWHNAYPLRIKKFIGINYSPFLVRLYKYIVRPFMSKKLQRRFHLFGEGDLESAYKELPQHLFPEKFGGKNGTISEGSDQLKAMVESYKDWFMDDYKYTNNETLRPAKRKN